MFRDDSNSLIKHLLHIALTPRAILLVLLMIMMLMPGWVPGLSTIDDALFRSVQPLVPKTSTPTKVTLVTLPTVPSVSVTEQRKAMQDLATWLPQRSPQQLLGIVLPDSWQQALHWMEQGDSLSLRLDANATTAQVQAASPEPLIHLTIANHQLPLPHSVLIHGGMPTNPAPYLDADNSHWPLLSKQGRVLSPSMIAALWLQTLNHHEQGWSPQSGLTHEQSLLPTDSAGGVYAWSPRSRITQRTWSAFQAQPDAVNGVVIFGADQAASYRTAGAIAALLDGRTAYTPWWGIAVQISAAFLALIFGWLLGRFGRGVQWLAIALLIVTLLISSWTLYLLAGYWLVATPAIIVLITLQLWRTLRAILPNPAQRTPDNTDQDMVETLQQVRLELARRQIDQGEPELAKNTLAECQPSPKVLEIYYDIAVGYERTRKTEQAREVYSLIHTRQHDFLDVEQRLARLPMSASQAATAGDVTMVTNQTLLLNDTPYTPDVLGRYEIEREIGRGAMGTVYLATDPMIGRKVAVKTVDFSNLVDDDREAFRQRFFREAEAAGRLSHPNIVTVYDVGEEHNLAYLAMDYVPGNTLSANTKADALLPVGTVFRLLAQVAEALAYAHQQGIVHRDIKPGNLIYNEETKQVKVSDFGIARVSDGTRTRTGTIMGSPSYMSPEQMAGGEVDGRSDIFSLGATLFQLLSGRLPFKGDNLAALAYQISKVKHPNVRDFRPDLPASATRIINKAMAKKPQDRYSDAAEMAEILQRSAERVRT